MIDPLVLSGGAVLTPGGLRDADLVIEGEVIAAVEPDAARSSNRVDVAGRWVLPGIVDLHGDAVERALSPRPSAPMTAESALVENDRAMLAAGITTAYLSLTDGFEPGLRSRERLREVIGAWRRLRPVLGVDTRIHVRHERCNVDDFDELLAWLADGTIELLSLNDHAPPPGHAPDGTAASVQARTGMSPDDALAVARRAVEQRPTGLEQEPELVAAAHTAGVPIASHDDADAEQVAASAALGVRIAEFPFTLAAAHAARGHGQSVLLGAPNLVRGGSHLGNLSVADAVSAGAVDVLASDYHYSSLLAAPFVAMDRGLTDVASAWSLVAERPARAAGLDDRGRLEAGQRADVIVVDPGARVRSPEIVVAGGEIAYSVRPSAVAAPAALPR
ncbi:MAG: alpha-D-ribose 1-methylphosphonate 5-triphosphate diphosphatase [Actinomycetota bacterium]